MPGNLPPDPTQPLPEEPGWPEVAPGRPVLVLADASSALERKVVHAWIERARPAGTAVDVLFLIPSRRRRRGAKTDPALAARLQRGDDPWVFPIRVVWLAGRHGERRVANWGDVLTFGDPRDPDVLRQRIILWKDPARLAIVVGVGAGAGELIAAHRESVEMMTLVGFATRRAHLALERAERELRGNRYKVPRFVKEEILSTAQFRDGVLEIASTAGIQTELAFAKARYYLGEIAASHSPFVIDLIANAIHWVYRQGYGGIIYDAGAVRDIAALGQDHPVAFLPSHRSNLDRLSLQYLLWENDMPPNHTAGGINMNFFPVGPLIRRTGVFFIRRTFKDNDLYKYVLRSYLDYLIERRFPLEWYLEGGRSRSGKLLPPRYGMLGWVVDSVARGKADDLYLIPTSIAYDQIQDVADYASEAQGGSKKQESFGWALSAIRSLRRRYGNIHIRFAEPMSVQKEIAVGGDDEVPIELQKLAFEVMYRIGQVTPITPTAVVSIVMLSTRGAPLDTATAARRAAAIDEYVETMDLPTTEPLVLERPAEVERTLDQLSAHGSVTRTETPEGPTFHLQPAQALQAAFYRNTVVHHFIAGAIAELAVLMADGPDLAESMYQRADEIRDLLKFEFFFPEREVFRDQIKTELTLISPDWESGLATDRERLLAEAPLLRAHWAILPFLESYQIVADELAELDGELNEKAFLSSAMDRGKRYRHEGAAVADESISLVLFKSALGLARNRHLVDDEAGRSGWAGEIAAVRAHAVRVAELAARNGS